MDVVSDASGRLVVIDDEAPILRHTHELLKSSGFEVRAFTNPLEAFVYLEANLEQVDLVIADRSMPGMTDRLRFGISDRLRRNTQATA